MKTWAAMYGLIWVTFAQILFVIYAVAFLSDPVITAIHATLGIVVFGLALYVSIKVKASGAPVRIKRTTATTRNFAVVQGLLGLVYAGAVMEGLSNTYLWVISFFHVAIALTILSQTSSTATGYDMWEEEFKGAAVAAPAAPQA